MDPAGEPGPEGQRTAPGHSATHLTGDDFESFIREDDNGEHFQR